MLTPLPGASLRDTLTAAFGDEAEAAWLIARGSVWVNGVRVRDPELRLPADATVVVQRPPDGVYRDPVVTPGMILYEDDDLIALDKPTDTYVEATPWDAEGHLRAALARFLEARDGSAPPLHLAHRLDRDTSGVLLLSKAPDVNAALQRAFHEKNGAENLSGALRRATRLRRDRDRNRSWTWTWRPLSGFSA